MSAPVPTTRDPFRYAGRPQTEQRAALADIVGANGALMRILRVMRDHPLPDPLVGGGAIYQNVWNALTGRAAWTGVKDIDAIYCDRDDLSWDAEDRVIKRMEAALPDMPVPIEVKNQARVHLWYPERFGQTVSPLTRSAQSLTRYASKTHAVAVRLDADDTPHIEAPFGLDDVFAFRITPNHALNNKDAHDAKAERAKAIWPELTILPW